MAVRSRPIPKAQPILSPTPAPERTSCFTTPHPHISSHSPFHQISISQDGEVQGKYASIQRALMGEKRSGSVDPALIAASRAWWNTWPMSSSIVFFKCLPISSVSSSDIVGWRGLPSWNGGSGSETIMPESGMLSRSS
ncbi:hypothetical protein AWJ20_2302 [Sugiyamaella lignohabitans]|uniref:Uncharacterized protein n=1 Tax=Sugiyamaella lignohabitans TaxID=796027 RepID=A0A161HM77_9ASCO|nr:uncharacterized protein AWJ20_2302 [Sugiyamaella lignohabitans]ANB14697.1 hypothetical protein AWJ20_2302 [Sugiyamaella lignohabitans]